MKAATKRPPKSKASDLKSRDVNNRNFGDIDDEWDQWLNSVKTSKDIEEQIKKDSFIESISKPSYS